MCISSFNQKYFPYKVAIWTNLNFYAYEDAIFLAERLCAEGIED